MEKDDYSKLFIKAIIKADNALVFEVDVETLTIEDGYLYASLDYQIDDRIERMGDDVEKAIQKELGKGYGVSVRRMDAFPNGYAAYNVVIDKILE